MQQTKLNIVRSLSLSRYRAGLRIISNLDEVAFIQNLVFYIEAAYKVAVSNICSSISFISAFQVTQGHFTKPMVLVCHILHCPHLTLAGNDPPPAFASV